MILKTFPNVQDIQGLRFSSILLLPNLHYVFSHHLQCLTEFTLWYTEANQDWMSYMNDKVTSLDFHIEQLMTRETDLHSMTLRRRQDQQLYPTLPSMANQFYLKKVGNKKSQPIHFNDERRDPGYIIGEEVDEFNPLGDPIIDTFHSKILMLPTLNHLITLRLYFSEYMENLTFDGLFEFDERTIESIHQSCPLLERLELDCFNMNISEEYDMILMDLKEKEKKRNIHLM
ncbi:unnamed protein product [Cunninghamella blakesleeana]